MSNTPLICADYNFDALFQEWNKKIYAYALSKTKSTYIAEETVQRVLIKLWNNLNNKNIQIAIEAQVFCITKTTLLDLLKQENRRFQHLNKSNLDITYPATPLDIYNLKQLQESINLQIEKMPKIRQLVFKLSRMEGLTYLEIAHKLDISTKTVENHIGLALKQLKKAFSYISLYYLIFFWG